MSLRLLKAVAPLVLALVFSCLNARAYAQSHDYHAQINLDYNNNSVNGAFIGYYAAMRTGSLSSTCCSDPDSFINKEMWQITDNASYSAWVETGDTDGNIDSFATCRYFGCENGTNQYWHGAFCAYQVIEHPSGLLTYDEFGEVYDPVIKDHSFEIYSSGSFSNGYYHWDTYFDGYHECSLPQYYGTGLEQQAGVESNRHDDNGVNFMSQDPGDIYLLQFNNGNNGWHKWPALLGEYPYVPRNDFIDDMPYVFSCVPVYGCHNHPAYFTNYNPNDRGYSTVQFYH